MLTNCHCILEVCYDCMYDVYSICSECYDNCDEDECGECETCQACFDEYGCQNLCSGDCEYTCLSDPKYKIGRASCRERV